MFSSCLPFLHPLQLAKSWLPYSLIHSVHLPIGSFSHCIAALTVAMRHNEHASFPVLHWNFEVFCTWYCHLVQNTPQLASCWSNECFVDGKWPGHLVRIFLFYFIFLCAFYFWLVCILGSPPGGGGVPRLFWDHLTCLCWPDVNQLVPRLFSLAEYGSAGERSRRAKKRNIGRYTRLMINNSQ